MVYFVMPLINDIQINIQNVLKFLFTCTLIIFGSMPSFSGMWRQISGALDYFF